MYVDKFSKADKKADNLQYESKLDTSEDSSDEETVGRKKKPRVAYSPSPEKRPRNQSRNVTARKEVKLESSTLSSIYSKGDESRCKNSKSTAAAKSTTRAKVVATDLAGDFCQNFLYLALGMTKK